jgi:large subunit ribosomal protein L35
VWIGLIGHSESASEDPCVRAIRPRSGKENVVMPKMKSNRGAAKRFRTTGTGKMRRAHACKSHLLTGKSAKRMRGLRKGTLVDKADVKRMRVLAPYI